MAVLGALGDLVLALSADTAKFQSDLGRGARMAQKFQAEVGRALTQVATKLAAVGGAAGIGALINGQIDAADAALEMSQKLGVSTEFVSQLGVQAKLAGSSLDDIRVALTRLSVNASDTARGTGEAQEAFRALGISVTDANGKMKGTQQLFEEVVDELAGFQDGINKSAIEVKLFGKSGAELAPLINEFRKTQGEAAALGAIIGEKTAKAADELNDEMTRTSIAVQALGLNIARALLQPLRAVSEELTKTAQAANQFSLFGEAAKAVLQTLAIVGSDFKFVFQTMGLELTRVWETLNAIGKGPSGLKEAKLIWNTLGEEIKRSRKELDEFQNKVMGIEPALDGAAGGAMDMGVGLAAMTDRLKNAAPAMRDLAKEAKEAEEAFKKLKAHAMSAFAELDAGANADAEILKLQREEIEELADARTGSMMEWASEEERVAQHMSDLADITRSVESDTRVAARVASDFGFTFNSALEDAIINGSELSDVVKALEQDIARMILRQTVTKPLGDAVSGIVGKAIAGMFGGGPFTVAEEASMLGVPGRAMGGPFRGAAVVGERGPELVVGSGTVVPNHAIGGNTFIVDMRGASMEAVQRLEAYVASVDGSLERRAVAAVGVTQTRRGSSRIG